MIPVRREREVEIVELGQLELGDEHRGHAVERRAAFLLNGLKRSRAARMRAPG